MSALVAAQTGSEPPSAAFPGGAARADEGPPAAGLCCAERAYHGSRRLRIRALVLACMAVAS